MMADTDAARRSAPLLSSARRATARLSAAAAVAGLALAFIGLNAPSAGAAEPGDVSVSIATDPQLGPGQNLSVTVTLTNSGATATEPGSIEVVLDPDRITTRDELDAWLDGPSDEEDDPDDGPSVTVDAPGLAPSTNTTLTAAIPAASVGLTGSEWGARGIAATYTAGDAEVAEGRGTVTWYAGEPVPVTPVAVAMSMTAPVGTTGVLTGSELAQLTRPGGLLKRQLDGVVGRDVTIGIDPMIIASIRLLGTSAPESAVAWLDELAALDNETFPLAWADADLAVQAQAGLTQLLGPTSLDYAIDPANFSGETATPTPTPTTPESTATDSPAAEPSSSDAGVRSTDAPTPAPGSTEAPPTESPTASPTAGIPTIQPTLADLLSWPYTATNIAWPDSGTVAAPDPAVFAANGLTTTIMSSSDLAEPSTTTPRAAAVANDGDALVALADDRLSSALSAAVGSLTDLEWRTAMDQVAALLAVASTEGDTTSAVLAALDRGWPNSTRLPDTLDALAQLAWAAPAPLLTSLGSPAASVAIADVGEPADRVAVVPPLLQDEASLTAFSSALTDPAVLTGRERNEVLALLSIGWIEQPAPWAKALAEHREASVATLNSVSVSPSSSVLVVGSPTAIPVTIKNDFTSAVTVHVEATPSNGRLVVDNGVDVTVEAGSSSSVKIPVSAQVGSGTVGLTIALTSASGVAIGQPYTVVANVHADWEGIGAAILGTLVVLFFGFGVVRTIRRRRRERAAAENVADEPVADDPGAEVDPSDARDTAADVGTGAGTGASEPDDVVTDADAQNSDFPHSEPDDVVTADEPEQPRG
ncbi:MULTISPECIES: DUF6049 family protein [unclassified Leifsonia]|uniref:DUF6049 family protein n=1 Tax=unclassified Leifsonia TaxID=2663824 RepID=UPI000700E747|nr:MULTISPECIES: DUF6049 family protein [unclassified Leifsonia]KQX05127.1 hypothetical protein ASC59_12995 [Leifsonia sp. Root1293]KRA08760.1 hypothetical protein ASD61_12995 [Leifsonia sp. Root60]